MHLKILGLLLLSFTLHVQGMKEQKSLIAKNRSDQTQSLYRMPSGQASFPLGTEICYSAPMKNCNNNNKKSVSNDNRNKCNPTNNNVINVSVIGALGSEALKYLNPDKYQGAINTLGKIAGLSCNWILNNKKLSAAALVCLLYAALNGRLIFLHSKLKNPNHWSQWRSNLAIEELYLIPRQTFYNDLLTNIQTKYTNFRNFRDSLAPLSNFLEDAEREEGYIQQFISIIKMLKFLHVSGLIFYSNDFYKQLAKRSSRLLFIKSAFLNWYAERKLSTPEREQLVRRFPRVKNILGTDPANYLINPTEMLAISPEETTDKILEEIVII